MTGCTNPVVLTVNAGSSSIKFALFEMGAAVQKTLSGAIERIGSARATLSVTDPRAAAPESHAVAAPDHNAAIHVLMDWIEQHGLHDKLMAIGHRLVHGGPHYSAPQRLNLAMIGELHRLIPFDPQHMPQEIQLAEAFHRRFLGLPQIACFDTAYFHELPRVARILPIPRRYEALGVRRYGFHGLSYEFLAGELDRLCPGETSKRRVIYAHLGNGSSLAAVQDGVPIDTSMSFTPAAGVPMGTRSGDIDPGLMWHLFRTEDMSPARFDDMINFKSGLLGISETSADMRDLLDREKEDVRAREAVALYCYEIKKRIGAYAAALGGLDQLVFAGGVGEHAPAVRARICDGLNFLGIDIDDARNQAGAPLISTDDSRTQVRVIRTDEEVIIARSVAEALNLGAKPHA